MDVTELYLRARTGEEVTGVQRVVLEVAHELGAAGAAELVILNPYTGGFHRVDASVLSGSELYRTDRLRGRFGRAPKIRNLAKYRPYTAKRAFFEAEQRVRRAAWRVRAHGLGRALDLEGRVLMLLGGFEINRRSALHARAGSPGARIVAAIYDAIPLRRPGDATNFDVAFRDAVNATVATGARILAGSEHTRRDLEAAVEEGLLDQPAAPIRAFPLPHEVREPTAPGAPAPEGPYLLMVGPIHGRKNGALVFDAYERLLTRGLQPPKLVCAGRLRADAPTLFAPGGPHAALGGHVILRDQPDHASLVNLYRGAWALVYPSLYEGFGLPVGEALWLGAPVLSSNATSLPEAGGDAPAYFDPRSVDELAALIERVTVEPAFVEELRARAARRRPQLLTWREAAFRLRELALE